jgi:hypothetical protein
VARQLDWIVRASLVALEVQLGADAGVERLRAACVIGAVGLLTTFCVRFW